MVLAPGLWWAGEAGDARAILESATRTAQAAGIDATVVYALGIRVAIALDEPDEVAAEALAREAIGLMHKAELDEHPWAAMAHIVHGRLLGRRDELAAASEEIERGIAFGQRLRAWQLIAYASLALAEVRQRQHQPTAARRLLTRVRDLLESIPDPGDGLSRLERTEKALRLRATRDRDATSAPFWELSQREMEVLRLLPSQLSQREIAAELYVSFNTIRTHTPVIFQSSASHRVPKRSPAHASSVSSSAAPALTARWVGAEITPRSRRVRPALRDDASRSGVRALGPISTGRRGCGAVSLLEGDQAARELE
jgi:LuxR family maltose regulon positive regulatory protein